MNTEANQSANPAAQNAKPLGQTKLAQWLKPTLKQHYSSALSNADNLKASLDLSGANPNGMSRLLSSGSATVDMLFRESATRMSAEREVERLWHLTRENGEEYGSEELSVAYGFASWTAPDYQSAKSPASASPAASSADAREAQPLISQGEKKEGAAEQGAEQSSAAQEGSAQAYSAQASENRAAQADSAQAPEQAHAPAEQTQQGSSVQAATAAQPAATQPAPTQKQRKAAAEPIQVEHMPVVLFPAQLEIPANKVMSQAQLKLIKRVTINPVFLSHLAQCGVHLNIDEIITSSEYRPGAVNERFILQKIEVAVQDVIPNFTIDKTMIVGCFNDPRFMLAARSAAILLDARNRAKTPVIIQALAEDAGSIRALHDAQLESFSQEDADPHAELEVGDVSNTVRYAARQVSKGTSLFINAPMGNESARQALAVASRVAQTGKSVLYVAGNLEQKKLFKQQAEHNKMASAIADVADPEVARDIDTTLVAALNSKNHADQSMSAFIRTSDELSGLRQRLSGYFDELHHEVKPWQVSAYDAIEHLAKLASLPQRPRNRVRFSQQTAQRLAGKLDEYADQLVRLGELHGYTLGPQDTTWYHAALYTHEQAHQATIRVIRLLDKTLPTLRKQIAAAVTATGFPVPQSPAEWGQQLNVLQGVRQVLDVFTPEVFERDLDPFLEATLSKKERKERKGQAGSMGWWERHRMKREIRHLLRPGMHDLDLHEVLEEVRHQSRRWHDMVTRGGWPTIPDGLDEMVNSFDDLNSDITALDAVLASTPRTTPLGELSFVQLDHDLRALYADRKDLDSLPERASLERDLVQAGLGDLLENLSSRHIETDQAPAELRLAWWSTVFEQLVHTTGILSDQDGSLLRQTVEDFRSLDAKHIQTIGPRVCQELTKKLVQLLYSDEAKANRFHQLLSTSAASNITQIAAKFPDLIAAAKPIWVVSAGEAARFGSNLHADVVILDGFERASVEQIIVALAAGTSTAVVADGEHTVNPVLRYVMKLLPVVEVPVAPASLPAVLVQFLLAHHRELAVLPAPGVPWDAPVGLKTRQSINWVFTNSTGLPVNNSVVSSTKEGVAAVVAEVRRQAGDPARSSAHLSIITLTDEDRQLIVEALNGEARSSEVMRRFLAKVSVLTIASVGAALPGDVIISTSFGKLPSGTLLQQFGEVGQPGGDMLLYSALELVRGNLTLVSAFKAADMVDSRLTQPGSRLLKDILAWAEKVSREQHSAIRRTDPNSAAQWQAVEHIQSAGVLLSDLAQRLRARGYETAVSYGVNSGTSRLNLPLVVGKPGEGFTLAVFTDDEAFMAVPSLRLRHRTYPAQLAAAGWKTLQVWSVGLFVDPDRQIARIEKLLPLDADTKQKLEQAHTALSDLVEQSKVEHPVGAEEHEAGEQAQTADEPATGEPVSEPGGEAASSPAGDAQGADHSEAEAAQSESKEQHDAQ